MVRSASYRHSVRIQKEVRTADGQGGFTKTWQDLDVVPQHAEVIQGGGVELRKDDQTAFTNLYHVKMRFRDDVTPANRLIWVDGTVNHFLDIASVSDLTARRREITITATERVPGPTV